jgi:hypothetical protein
MTTIYGFGFDLARPRSRGARIARIDALATPLDTALVIPGSRAHRVSGARQRSGGVEKYSSIASRQAPEHGSTASSLGPDSRISAAIFSAQLMQTPARSIPQPVQLQLDL